MMRERYLTIDEMGERCKVLGDVLEECDKRFPFMEMLKLHRPWVYRSVVVRQWFRNRFGIRIPFKLFG